MPSYAVSVRKSSPKRDNAFPRGVPSAHLVPVRTPNGAIIGTIVLEGDQRVFVRRVTERIRFRLHDAWPLGAYALQQLMRWKVTLLRYISRDAICEVTLPDFIALSIAMEFPGHDEVQHVLPRSLWEIRPVRPASAHGRSASEQLGLELTSLTSTTEVGT